MMWHWFFGKKHEDETDEDVKAVGVEGMMGERVDVEVTDPRPGSRLFRGKIKDPKVKHLNDDGEWVDGSAKEYTFDKKKARWRLW